MKKPIVYIVDDLKEMRALISGMLKDTGYQVIEFDSGNKFLELEEFADIGCLVLDNHMPGMSGLEVQLGLEARNCKLPIVFMSGASTYSDVVEAVQRGALDFLQKPFTKEKLLEQVHLAVAESVGYYEACKLRNSHIANLESLTPREYEVYNLVIFGHTNKVISVELEISVGTVEFHRANIMKKLDVNTLAELISISI